jgi:glucosamine-6-phosphate deaminase
MEIIIKQDSLDASATAARVVARLVREKPDAVLGLATGSTPLVLYRELVRMYEEEHPHSYHTFMWENLFSRINIDPRNVHLPDGMAEEVPASCENYEWKIRQAGGIDLQVLGIGSDGHIGFNEPTSSFASRTRIKTLTRQTVADNARFFGGDETKVPRHCITMGIGTIMEARMILMLAFGEAKADAVAASIEGPVAAVMPASFLQHHPAAKIFVDEAAAKGLRLADYYRWVYEGKPAWQRDS